MAWIPRKKEGGDERFRRANQLYNEREREREREKEREREREREKEREKCLLDFTLLHQLPRYTVLKLKSSYFSVAAYWVSIFLLMIAHSVAQI